MDGQDAAQPGGAARTAWRAVHVVVVLGLAAAAGYWLLGDTFGKYAPSAGARPLRVSFWGPFEEFRMWKEMLANFRRRHPDVPVRMEYFPSRYDQKIQQLMVAADAPDVILYQDEPFPNIIERDAARGIEPKFADLTELAARRGERLTREGLLETFWATSVEAFGRWEGEGAGRAWHQYGLPVWGGCNLFYYNKACFRRAGIRLARLPGPKGLVADPNGGWLLDDEQWDLDEFVEACKLLRRDADGDGRVDQFGLSLGSALYWLPLHYACGADILNEDRTRTAFLGPAVEKSLTLWQDVVFKYHVSPRAAELGQMGEGVGFLTGRVAMFCSGPWGMPFLNEAQLDYDVLHVPRNAQTRRRATRITWDCVAVAAGSPKKDDAWLLVRHLTSMESMKVVANVQRSIPARKEAQDYFVQVNPKVTVRKFVEAAGAYARTQPITRHWSIMERAWRDAMSELRRDNPAKRLTVPQAIGMFHEQPKLRQVLPPADEALAEQYRRAYRQRLSRAPPEAPRR
jgi:multiple sugar transport system substrate-binding protein